MTLANRGEMLAAVVWEMARQDLLHGMDRDRKPDAWLRTLVEEVGEIARAIDHNDLAGFGVECVHVAAVAIQMAEWLRNYHRDCGREAMSVIEAHLAAAQEKAAERAREARP